MRGKRLTQEEVAKGLLDTEHGPFTLTENSNKYSNCSTKLTISCPFGHIFEETYSNIVHNEQMCPVCWAEKQPKHAAAVKRRRKNAPLPNPFS